MIKCSSSFSVRFLVFDDELSLSACHLLSCWHRQSSINSLSLCTIRIMTTKKTSANKFQCSFIVSAFLVYFLFSTKNKQINKPFVVTRLTCVEMCVFYFSLFTRLQLIFDFIKSNTINQRRIVRVHIDCCIYFLCPSSMIYTQMW
jgi:hypothetical protein